MLKCLKGIENRRACLFCKVLRRWFNYNIFRSVWKSNDGPCLINTIFFKFLSHFFKVKIFLCECFFALLFIRSFHSALHYLPFSCFFIFYSLVFIYFLLLLFFFFFLTKWEFFLPFPLDLGTIKIIVNLAYYSVAHQRI